MLVCGRQNIRTRIINGQEAQRDRYPWMVSLLIGQGGGSYSSCGGSIITDRHILTAAHCVAGNPRPDDVIAMVGAHTNEERQRAGKGQMKLKVRSIKSHENYDHDGSKMDDDIAIMTIDPVVFDYEFNPICLPNFSEHPQLFIPGWGRQNFGRSLGQAKVLHDVQLDEVDNSTCTQKYWGSSFKPEKEICAGLVKSTCQGDSGGPLSFLDQDGTSYQVGITSFGTPKCGVGDAPKPAVYERVTAHLKWIERNTQGAKWCPGPRSPAFTKKNIGQQGKSYKSGGQGAGSSPRTQSSQPSYNAPRARPTLTDGLDSLDFTKMPSSSGSIRVIRTMGPDGKITERIERGNSGPMSPDFEEMMRRAGLGSVRDLFN